MKDKAFNMPKGKAEEYVEKAIANQTYCKLPFL